MRQGGNDMNKTMKNKAVTQKLIILGVLVVMFLF